MDNNTMTTKFKKQTENYIDNEKFTEEAIKWIELKKLDPSITQTRYLGECIILIATRIANMPCFQNYSFKDEMISDAIENCIRYFDRYNPEAISKRTGKKTIGAFPYMTTIAYYAMVRRIATEKKQMFLKQKYIAVAMEDIFVVQEHEIGLVNEEYCNILREMSGNDYVEYDIKIAVKKQTSADILLSQKITNIEDIIVEIF